MENKSITMSYILPNRDNLAEAGVASSAVKKTLNMLGVDPKVVKKMAISMYEAEINAVIHADGGEALAVISEDAVVVTIKDNGPGIPNLELAMTEGYSTATDLVRSMGFGAGMGLPNIKRYADNLDIQTEVGKGTVLTITVYLH